MLKIVQLRLTTIVPEHYRMIGQGLPQESKDRIAAESEHNQTELDGALNEGYAIVSEQIFSDRTGAFLHLVLHKPDDQQVEEEMFE